MCNDKALCLYQLTEFKQRKNGDGSTLVEFVRRCFRLLFNIVNMCVYYILDDYMYVLGVHVYLNVFVKM